MDLDEQIVAHFVNPKKYTCPSALALNWQLGDYHLMVAGGIWDQPAGEFLAQRHAGYIWYLLETEAKATVNMPVESTLKESDLAVLRGDPKQPEDEGLRGIRKMIIQRDNAAAD